MAQKKTSKKSAASTKTIKKKTSKKSKSPKKTESTSSTKTAVKAALRKATKKKIARHLRFVDMSLEEQRAILKARRIHWNDDKKRIAIDMLERYTGHALENIQPQIILTNFHYYVERFVATFDDAVYTEGSAFKAASSAKARVTIIEFGVGSAMAALIGEIISVAEPKAALFLGLAGSVHPSLKVGDFVLPIASIRGEGVSKHFLPTQVPALPTFKVQKFVSQILVESGFEYRTGTIHSTDFRFWEFDERFKKNLIEERVLAVEMETAALFTSCFVSKVNIGALILISDCPLKKGGIKTKASAKAVFREYTDLHIELGIKAMAEIADRGEKIRHYTWE